MKFRKKPVIVEAERYDGSKESIARILRLEGASRPYRGRIRLYENFYENFLVIPTLEGNHRADEGDWIIKGVKGELYPCKSDIFEATYEKIE